LVVAALGGAIAYFVNESERAAHHARFEVVADQAAAAIATRIHQHFTLLTSAGAFRQAVPAAFTRPAFSQFVGGLDLARRYTGIQGIGLTLMVPPGGDAGIIATIADAYGGAPVLWPQSGEAIRTAIVYLEPADERNLAALGYDMYTEAKRREAMARALATGEVAATAPVTLVQEITADKQAGFLAYLPVRDAGGRVDGFIYAAFRAGDLHRAALDGLSLPAELSTSDRDGAEGGGGADEGETVLFVTPGFEAAGEQARQVEREIDVGGRTWRLRLREAAAEAGLASIPYTVITFVISLLLATAMAAALWWQLQSLERARALKDVSDKSLQEKDLMLQEMKHRIKNSIARILAMARQTAASSATIEDFSTSFTARLQSMANAQDMLTRSHWAQTDLRELLRTELLQVFGSELDDARLSGPPVLLDGRQTQSLGLTFHELATNALKYGAAADPDGELSIDWRVTGEGRKRELVLVWSEIAARETAIPQRRGFGGRLMDASIKGELSGALEREFHETGLRITIAIPLGATDPHRKS
jgi:two-component sensor histidine kinase